MVEAEQALEVAKLKEYANKIARALEKTTGKPLSEREIKIVYSAERADAWGGGFYDEKTKTVYISPSLSKRDKVFTTKHEVSHLLQHIYNPHAFEYIPSEKLTGKNV